MTVVEAEAEDGGGVDVVFFFFSSSVFSICVFSRALQRTQRLRYRTVQNPVVLSLAREKANLRNMHPDVIAQTDKINKGSKRNLTLTEQKADLVGVLRKRKRQRDFGRFKAMKYFKQDNNKRLTWSALLFNDTKEGVSNANGIKHSCHLEKELSSTKL